MAVIFANNIPKVPVCQSERVNPICWEAIGVTRQKNWEKRVEMWDLYKKGN